MYNNMRIVNGNPIILILPQLFSVYVPGHKPPMVIAISGFLKCVKSGGERQRQRQTETDR